MSVLSLPELVVLIGIIVAFALFAFTLLGVSIYVALAPAPEEQAVTRQVPPREVPPAEHAHA